MIKIVDRGAALASAAILAIAVLPGAAIAGPKVVSGERDGFSWTAQNTIVGQTSTATLISGGDPLYTAAFPAYSGVVGLLMNYGPSGAFVCSGTLLNDRRSILTAGHCVSSSPGGVVDSDLQSVTAFFRGPGSDADTYVYPSSGVVDPTVSTMLVSDIFVNTSYTAQVIDQNDIAVLRLSDLAPAFATSYDLYLGGDLTGQDFTVAGYGTRSVTGGNDGTTGDGAGAGVGRFRVGENRYDYAWGDSDFGGFFTDIIGGENFFGTAEIEYSYISDFDNGLLRNDTACLLAVFGLGTAPSSKFCDQGLGATEVGIAGGDSGGPGFIDGQIASINSYGLTFGTYWGDHKAGLNSSWGEFNGFVPVYIHEDFIRSVMVPIPEPGTWLQMIGGLALLGGVMRHRTARLSFA